MDSFCFSWLREFGTVSRLLILETAIEITREAGVLLRSRFHEPQTVNFAEKHDIKLQIDVDCQRLIEERIMAKFPDHSIIGEEESRGNPQSIYRWIVDPLDGTVNYNHGIPHFAVSVAVQQRVESPPAHPEWGSYENLVGVIYDPMREELYHSEKGKGAFLNQKSIKASDRKRLQDAILSVGLSKTPEGMEVGVARYIKLVRLARKIRNMGSAALDLAYVASGRLEAYVEAKVGLWDIAAGVLLVEEAGGRVDLKLGDTMGQAFAIVAANAHLDFQEYL
jgi:myo-inositol-1(or 4)-monophosphatase